MNDGDKLHVIIKDLVGTMPTIELSNEEGVVEDSYPEYAESEYGAMYNWHTTTDARELCPSGWHIPTIAECVTLRLFLDPVVLGWGNNTNIAGGYLKDVSANYWLTPNVGADNSSGFTGRGTGFRGNWGFAFIKTAGYYWNSDSYDLSSAHYFSLSYNSESLFNNFNGQSLTAGKYAGMAIRPIKNSTTLTNGQVSTMTGNDGRVYNSICIGTQEWLSENLKETLFRDGSPIPVVEDDATWVALTNAGMCYYNNDESYA
jgi:uncharacterized protein (TIGR02145 family)